MTSARRPAPAAARLRRPGLRALAAALCLLAAAPSAAAPPDIRSETLSSAPGTGKARATSTITGRQTVDYRLRGGAGQTLTVTLSASHGQAHFNLAPPGSGVAMFNGSVAGRRYSGTLPDDGEYTVRIYLMRAAARRGATSRFTLQAALAGKPLAPVPADDDARIPGTHFHAAATVPCTLAADPARKDCDAFVVRRGFDGTATVEVRWPEGPVQRLRRILFLRGVAVAADSPDPVTHARRGDRHAVRIGGDETFEIPEAFIAGG
ncbi:MAG: hypothetical protein JNM82_16905 [Rhodocyclaceae bacterium]|nr:hypothetical protein [Rhodocyclaceae bacterium]